MQFLYEDGDRKLNCLGCGKPTKGLLVVLLDGNPLPQKLTMCPRCRDTKAKHSVYEKYTKTPIPQHLYRSQEDQFPFEVVRPQKGISFWDMTEEERYKIIQDPNWIADPKIDGARGLLYFIGGKELMLDLGEVHLLSSRISKKSGEYSDRSKNFPQITGMGNRFQVKELDGTVLDGEVFINKKGFVTGAGQTDSTLNETVACMNASPETAVRLQKENDAWATFYVFDCLKFKGEDIREKPYYYRRLKAEQAVCLYAAEHVKILACTADREVINLWYDYTENEGIVFKDSKAPYYAPSVGARNKGMVKKKRMETYDGFITGFIPGEAGFKGLVGALLISAYIRAPDTKEWAPYSGLQLNKKPFEFAAVSNIPLVQRKLMTAEDGSLKKEYYNRVIEVRAQTKTRTGRLRHAVLLRWRSDKTPQECYYETQ